MTVAKLPLAKDIEEFDFTGTPINEGLVRDTGHWQLRHRPAQRRLIGRHRNRQKPISPSPLPCVSAHGTRGRFYNVVDLVSGGDRDRGGKQGRLAIT